MKYSSTAALALIFVSAANAAPSVAPYGSWSSPVSIESVTSATRSVSDVLVDGSDVVLLEQRADEQGRTVALLRETQGAEKMLTPAGVNIDTRVHEYGGAPALLSNGVLYFSNKSDGRLYTQSLRGGSAPRPLTAEGPYRYADCAMDRARSRLICVREDHTDDRPVAVRNTLVAVPLAAGTAVKVLFDSTDFVASPKLRSDGSRIAFVTWNHPNMPWDTTSLRVASFDEAGRLADERVMVDAKRGVSAIQPSWSPDGTLYFISDESGWWNLWRSKGANVEPVAALQAEIGGPMWWFQRRDYAVLNDDSVIVAITENGVSRLATLTPSTRKYVSIGAPYVSYSGLAVSGSHVYAVGVASDRAAELIAIDPGKGVTVLRKEASIGLPPEMISRAESITFDNREGEKVQAFYYPPRNTGFVAPKGEKPPVLVLAHGGPTYLSSSGYRADLQFWTTRGFAVLDVNYSGSTGFGTAYRKRLNGRWGEVDINDVVDAAKAAAARGLVDPKRMVIKGGSAGGFVVLAALAFQNDAFAAGINYYGVSDLAVLARDTHKFESRYLDTLVGPLPRMQAVYTKRSPLSAVGNIRAPLLTLQGLEDKIVPPQQSESIMARIAANHVPSAYLAFEGEGHGFRGAKAKHASLEAELSFLGQVLNFKAADPVPMLPLRMSSANVSFSPSLARQP